MTLSIQLNGFNYEGFTNAQVTRNIETAASTFLFETTTSGVDFIPIRAGDEVAIMADDTFKILTGFVDEESSKYDESSHTVSIKGRSITQDLIDSTIGFVDNFASIDFVRLCTIVAAQFGVEVKSLLDNDDILLLENLVSPEVAQNAFEFLESFARKKQVLLTDDEDGNLVITRASSTISPLSLKNKIGGKDNNIKKGSRSLNIEGLYNQYIAHSQKIPIDVTEFEDPGDLVDLIAEIFDSEIRSTRKFEFYSEEAIDSISLKNRAKWELSLRRARNFVYKATVEGHISDGILWKPNVIHQIDDDFSGLKGQFLCNNIFYKFDLENGSTTELGFTNKNAYTLQADEDTIITEF